MKKETKKHTQKTKEDLYALQKRIKNKCFLAVLCKC